VAQVPVTPSTVPVWQDGACVARPLVLRVFAVADGDGAGYSVMPGGLARIVDDGRTWAASFQRGGGSKDAWVLADGPVAPVTLLRPADAPLEFKRGSADLPSRVADNLFWLGRYGARAEDSARLLRAALARLAGDHDAQGEQGMLVMLRVLKRLGTLARPAAEAPAIEAQLLALVNDADDEGSLLTSLRRLHYAAFASRDRLSNDTWRIVNHLEQDLGGSAPVVRAIEALPRLDRLVIDLAALAGMVTENTTRGPGWRFLDLGRRMERASFTADLLRAALVPRVDEAALEAVLEVADSAITYRARYLAALQVPAVIDLLLNDATNPRSVAFQLERIADHVANLPRPGGQALPTSAERLAIGAHTWVRLVDPNALGRQDEEGERGDLAHVLDHLSSDLELLSNAITTSHLSHAAIIRQGAPALPAE
jgi:uncharacterized alpha-E superfamily protein